MTQHQTDPLRRALADPWLHAVIDSLVGRPGIPTSELYDRLSFSLDVEELVIPVVGVQGSGKSTLLSALLFNRPVLPTDVDETTCVPTEIRFGETLAAEVEYRDGRIEQLEPFEDALARVVHNEHNPGNALGVRCLRVRVDDDLLRSGLVLVDLPGLGSLTRENAATTQSYVRSCVAVLVLLRTTPPLTRHDAIVVGSIWPVVPELLFAQNQWTVETDDQASEGLEYNIYKLRELAKRVRVALDDDGPDVTVVCAWRGQTDRFRSGEIPQDVARLRATLRSLATSWRGRVHASVVAQVSIDIAQARLSAEQERASLSKDEEEIHVQRAAMKERFAAFKADLKARRNAGLEKVEDTAASLQRYTSDWGRETKQKLRNAMRTKTRGGIVDGLRLDEAFAQEQQEYLDLLLEHCQHRVADLRDDLHETFHGISDWDFGRQVPLQQASLKELRKYETHLPELSGAAGGIAATAAFATMGAGAKIGAALGVPAGPAGSAVGAVAGALVGITAFFLGKALGAGAKHLASRARQKRADAAISPHITNFVDDSKRGLTAQLDQMEEVFRSSLASWLKSEQERFRKEEHKQSQRLALDADEKARRAEEFRGTIERLEKLDTSLSGATNA